MNRKDHRIIFTALAFITVILRDGKQSIDNDAEKVLGLAGLLSKFCDHNIAATTPSDQAEEETDAIIERHVKELREKYETTLPQDSESLMPLYVRLQFRKIHRINAVLFEKITSDKLADLVLSQLDEEIEYQESLS